jgi:hypothetical protein
MNKITIALLISAILTPAFADTKTTKQSTQKTATKIYPMDSFDPNKFSVSNIPEFTKRYFSEAEVFLKKGEFETTAEYEERIAQGFKLKFLDSNKIYAFELDSTKIDYDVDTAQYKIRTGGFGVGDILEEESYLERNNFNVLRVGKIHRKTGSYIGENAYGLKVKIQELEGEDFYIKSSSNLKYTKEDVIVPILTFPISVEKAKQYSTCSKKLYVFAQLNNSKPNTSSNITGAVNTPTRNIPIKMYVTGKVIPMDIQGTVLKCSNGQVIGTMYPETPLTKEAEKSRKMEIWQTNTLNKAIKHWKRPESLNGMTDSQIQVKVDDKGHLINLYWLNPTGIRAIDRSIVNAFKDAAPFDPPLDISSASTGIVITFPSIQQPPVN